MNTIAKSYSGTISVDSEKIQQGFASPFWKKAEFNRFGITPLLLVLISCVGGAAAAVGVEQQSTFKIAAAAFPTAVGLSMVLGLTPMRVIAATCALAIIVDLLVVFF